MIKDAGDGVPLLHVDAGSLEDKVSKATTDTANKGKGVQDAVATGNGGVVNTEHVLEVLLLND